MAGLFRFLPIERINAVLVITPQPDYLDDAEAWLRKLDRGGSESGSQLYVYYVKNVKAVDLSEEADRDLYWPDQFAHVVEWAERCRRRRSGRRIGRDQNLRQQEQCSQAGECTAPGQRQ